MPFLRKYNTLTVTGTTAIRIPIIKRAVVDFAVGADWTPAAGDVKILVDGTAAANVANLPTAIASGNGAVWEFILTAAELSCKQCEVTIVDSATKAIEDQSFIVETFGNASAMYQADLAAANLPVNVIQVNGTAQTAGDIPARLPAALVSGRMDSSVGAMAANVLTATAINADAITAAKIADAAIDAATFAAGAINAAAIAADAITAAKVADGTIDAATFAAGAINAAAIAADAITDAKVAADVTIASVTGAVGSVTAGVTVTTNNDKTGYALSAAGVAAIWNEVVDGAFTARQLVRGFASALLSICSGMATSTGVFRDISNTKNRLSVTQDANGNRSAFGTLDLS